jgi:hypothetical protein
MKPQTDFCEDGLSHENAIVIDSCDWPHKDNDVSINESTSGTIKVDPLSNRGLRLFPGDLDAIIEDDGLGKVAKVLGPLIDSVQDLHERVNTLEMLSAKKSQHTKRIDWKEIISLAEFRIAERGGKITQKELQRTLEIASRTTMTNLVGLLKNTGRYTVWREGRKNIIEVAQ